MGLGRVRHGQVLAGRDREFLLRLLELALEAAHLVRVRGRVRARVRARARVRVRVRCSSLRSKPLTLPRLK